MSVIISCTVLILIFEFFLKKLKFVKILKIVENLENCGKFGKFRKNDTCFCLTWSTLICLGLLALFLITIERLKCSKAISGWVGIGIGIGMEITVGTDSKSTALRC